MSDEDKTPVDRFYSINEIVDALKESTKASRLCIEKSQEMRDYCKDACNAAIAASVEIPALHKRIDRIVMFQAWFPTVLVSAAVIVKLIFLK